MKTVVIGSGSWGTGLGQVLCDNGREVIIYGNCKEQIDDIEQNHRNAMFFEDVQLNPDLHATMDVNVVKDADVVVLSVPTIAIESVCRQIDPLLKGKVMLPELAIVDPQFTMTAPAKVTVNTGLDALCHAVEAYTSRRAQTMSDVFAVSAAVSVVVNAVG